MLNLQTILYATDFSKPAEYALEVAGSLAKDHDARLVVLTVFPPPVTAVELFLPAPSEDYKELELKTVHQLEARHPQLRGLRVEALVANGDEATEIVRVARVVHADLVVMGSHGRTGLKRLLLGSVAERVLRTASCPVLIVKTPAALCEEAPTPEALDHPEPAGVAS